MTKQLKIVILGIDTNIEEIGPIASEMAKIGEKLGYAFLFTGVDIIKSIDKDELLKALNEIK